MLRIPPPRTLASFGFSDTDLVRLQTLVGAAPSEPPPLERIRRAAAAPELSPEARAFLQLAAGHIVLQAPPAGQLVVGGGVAEMAAQQFIALAEVPKTRSERPEVMAFRAAMPPALVGHEDTRALEACAAGLADFYKPLRQTPPLVAINALPGHGLEQLVEGFAQVAFGKSAITPAPSALSTAELQQLATAGGGVVHVHCHSDSDTTALRSALTATRRQAHSANVIFVVSFDGAPGSDARKALADALGNDVASCCSGDASLNRLGPAAMAQYAVRYLDQMFTHAFRQHRLTIEETALHALSQLLATPHRPLGEPELGNRIQRLVFEGFNEQDLLNPNGALVEIALAARYQQPADFRDLVAAVHEEGARLTDFNDVFLVAEKGKLQPVNPERISLRQRFQEMRDLAISQLQAINESIAATTTDPAAAFDHLVRVMRVVGSELDVAQATSSAFLADSRQVELAAACTAASQALKPLKKSRDPMTLLCEAAATQTIGDVADWLSDVGQLNEPPSLRAPPPVVVEHAAARIKLFEK